MRRIEIPKDCLERLYLEDEWEICELAKRFNCSNATIYGRINEYEIPHMLKRWSDEEIIEELKKVQERLGHSPSYWELRKMDVGLASACEKHFGCWNKAKKAAGLEVTEHRYELSEEQKMPTFEVGYVVGVVIGDGSLHKGVISLRVTDKEFIDYFKDIAEGWLNKEFRITKAEPKDSVINGRVVKFYKRTYGVNVCSIEVCDLLREYMSIEFIRSQNIEFRHGVLKGFFDSEGCIAGTNNCKTPRIIMTNKNRKLLLLMKEIGTTLGLKRGGIWKGSQQEIYNLEFGGQGNLVIFYEIIGVTIQRKISPWLDKIEMWKRKRRKYERAMEIKRGGLGYYRVYKRMLSEGFDIGVGEVNGWFIGRIPFCIR